MALINKTAAETLARLGPGCVPDLMELFGPKDKTKEGVMLLALAANATQDAEAVPRMLDLGYKIQPEMLGWGVAEAVLEKAIEGRSAKDLGGLAHPKQSSEEFLMRIAPSSLALSLFEQLMESRPKMGAMSARLVLEASFAKGFWEGKGRGGRIEPAVEHAKGMMLAMAANPECDAAAFDWLASPECRLLVAEKLVAPVVRMDAMEAIPGILYLLGQLGRGGELSLSIEEAARELCERWKADCETKAMSSTASTAKSRRSESTGGKRL